jgi:hypothetical protein
MCENLLLYITKRPILTCQTCFLSFIPQLLDVFNLVQRTNLPFSYCFFWNVVFIYLFKPVSPQHTTTDQTANYKTFKLI